MLIRFTTKGARTIHDDAHADFLRTVGFKPPQRATRIEPIRTGPNAWKWSVDFSPLGDNWQFCLWPPSPTHKAALETEHAYLEEHWVKEVPCPDPANL